MSGAEDRAKGVGDEVGGKAREAAGRVTGDPGMRAEGEQQQVKGKGRSLLGRFKTFLARRG
jgi:uncharacterized protein YjbJ (UPF0337 family)